MTKQEYVDVLIKDPAYDADWIDKVSDLLSSYSSDELKKVGIDNLDMLDNLDVRMIHIINSLIPRYSFNMQPDSKEEYNNDLVSTMISYIVKQQWHMNATQAQLIATIVDYKTQDPDIDDNFDSFVLGDLIEADIPYSSLNFIAKAIIEGHSDIVKYRNSDPDIVAAIYALLAEGLYDRVSKELRFDDNTTDYNLNCVSHCAINVIRFYIINGINYEIKDNGNIETRIEIM